MAGSAKHKLGLALSGGGSRAAAFHCGVVEALEELGLVPEIDVVSTVSGGSVFGAAWMAALARGESTGAFLKAMEGQLRRGFILRSVGWRLIKLLIPGYTRTELIAETFDRLFFKGVSIEALPERPLLCINTSVLNNGQVGKFSRLGFSTEGLGPPRLPGGSHPQVQLKAFKVSRAAAASAAFPIGLPPILLRKREMKDNPEFHSDLKGHSTLAITDGGIIENLGAQTLLRSLTFGTNDLIVSDAGTKEPAWRPYKFGYWIKAIFIAVLSASSLERILLVMNNKQNRSMRSALVTEVRGERGDPSRRLLFVRINQDWDRLLGGVPKDVLAGHFGTEPVPKGAAAVEQRLKQVQGLDLSAAKKAYDEIGGAEGARLANEVSTNFTGLSEATLKILRGHARWQVLLLHELYWKRGSPLSEPPAQAGQVAKTTGESV